MGYFVTPDQVRGAVDAGALLQLCDASREVADDNACLQLAMMRAHSEVTSNLAVEWPQMPRELPDGPVSTFLVNAELAYVEYFLYRRKPALAAKIGPNFLSDLRKEAEARMDRLKSAVQEIAPNDNPPPAQPTNLGGVTVDNGPQMLSATPGVIGGGNGGNKGPSNFGDF